MHINIHKGGTNFAKPGTKVASSDISFPGKGLMAIPFVNEDDWDQPSIRIETLDNPVPYSISNRRPFDGLSDDSLRSPIGRVLGKILLSTHWSVKDKNIILFRWGASLVWYPKSCPQ